MATMGLKYMAWAKMKDEPMTALPTYEPGIVLGRVVSTNMTVTNAEGELHADDMVAEYASEFSSAQLQAETDNIELSNQAKLYGARYADGEMQHYGDDTAPNGGVGGYQVLLVRNVRKFRSWFFPKAKASIPDWTGATKAGNISFGTQPIKMRILSPNFGPWYTVKEFTTEAAAQAYIDERLGVAIWHRISIQAQGADGVTNAVAPVGDTYVAHEGELRLAIVGTPTALYDNGAEKSADIVGGEYVIANVAEEHRIAVIF